jgi:hypothetical protein
MGVSNPGAKSDATLSAAASARRSTKRTCAPEFASVLGPEFEEELTQLAEMLASGKIDKQPKQPRPVRACPSIPDRAGLPLCATTHT